MSKTILAVSAFCIILNSSITLAQDRPSGLRIAQNINARDEGNSLTQNLEMTLTDKRGKTRNRVTQTFRKYYGETKKTVIFYQSPSNVKGTGFLTFDYPEANKDDDQWLYLPALRKVRRISASKKGDYFLGTDLTYEDINNGTRVNTGEYNRKTTGEDTIDGHHCYIVEAIPKEEKIIKKLGYSKVIEWVDSKIWIVRKAKFWDKAGNDLKEVFFKDIHQVEGIWTLGRIEARNFKTGHSTVFKFSNQVYNKGVRDDLFTERALKRGI